MGVVLSLPLAGGLRHSRAVLFHEAMILEGPHARPARPTRRNSRYV